jgi:predicted RNA-binding protein YlxR (DUF448 family)
MASEAADPAGGEEQGVRRGRLPAAGVTARRPTGSGRLFREPQRTCVGCRERDDRSVLLRMVAAGVDGNWAVIPDPDHQRGGRGASLHLDTACLERAIRRRVFSRAFRRKGTPDLTALRAYLAAAGTTNPVHTVRVGSGSEADEHPMSTQR